MQKLCILVRGALFRDDPSWRMISNLRGEGSDRIGVGGRLLWSLIDEIGLAKRDG